MSRPLIKRCVSRADDAYAAHAALLKAETAEPRLRANPFWTVLRQDAYERFGVELTKGDGCG